MFKQAKSHRLTNHICRAEELEIRALMSAVPLDVEGMDLVPVAGEIAVEEPGSLSYITDEMILAEQNYLKTSVIEVTTFEDVQSSEDGQISLREALAKASEAEDDMTIVFACGGEKRTIFLDSELRSLQIASNVTIQGGGLVTIDGSKGNEKNGGFSLLTISDSATVNLLDLTLANSYANDVGGIVNAGKLNLYNCTISNCYGLTVGAVNNEGEMYVYNSHFTKNACDDSIYQRVAGINNEGTLTIYKSDFSYNEGWTGAVYNSAILYVKETTFTGNKGVNGGAIFVDTFNSGCKTSIEKCTFTQNSVPGLMDENSAVLGQSIESSRGLGGAICICSDTKDENNWVYIANNTFEKCSAGYGGALYYCNSLLMYGFVMPDEDPKEIQSSVMSISWTGNTCSGNSAGVYNFETAIYGCTASYSENTSNLGGFAYVIIDFSSISGTSTTPKAVYYSNQFNTTSRPSGYESGSFKDVTTVSVSLTSSVTSLTDLQTPITLTASGTNATNYFWDLDGDGVYDDETGASVTFVPGEYLKNDSSLLYFSVKAVNGSNCSIMDSLKFSCAGIQFAVPASKITLSVEETSTSVSVNALWSGVGPSKVRYRLQDSEVSSEYTAWKVYDVPESSTNGFTLKLNPGVRYELEFYQNGSWGKADNASSTGEISALAIPALSSSPESVKSIYLDFNGSMVTGQDSTKGFITWYGTDSTSISNIQTIQNKIAEYFCNYDVNITTQCPTSGEYIHIVIGGNQAGISADGQYIVKNEGAIETQIANIMNQITQAIGLESSFETQWSESQKEFLLSYYGLLTEILPQTFGNLDKNSTSAELNGYIHSGDTNIFNFTAQNNLVYNFQFTQNAQSVNFQPLIKVFRGSTLLQTFMPDSQTFDFSVAAISGNDYRIEVSGLDSTYGAYKFGFVSASELTECNNLQVTKSALQISRGESDSWSVCLTSKPSANVVVQMDSNSSKTSLNREMLVFTPSNWNIAQTVTVALKEKLDAGQEEENSQITQILSSSDSNFNGKEQIVSVTATNDGLNPKVSLRVTQSATNGKDSTLPASQNSIPRWQKQTETTKEIYLEVWSTGGKGSCEQIFSYDSNLYELGEIKVPDGFSAVLMDPVSGQTPVENNSGYITKILKINYENEESKITGDVCLASIPLTLKYTVSGQEEINTFKGLTTTDSNGNVKEQIVNVYQVPYDLNGDSQITIVDLVEFAKRYNSIDQQANFDGDDSGIVGINDLVWFAKNYMASIENVTLPEKWIETHQTVISPVGAYDAAFSEIQLEEFPDDPLAEKMDFWKY